MATSSDLCMQQSANVESARSVAIALVEDADFYEALKDSKRAWGWSVPVCELTLYTGVAREQATVSPGLTVPHRVELL